MEKERTQTKLETTKEKEHKTRGRIQIKKCGKE
jgi:hypothetical protein